MNLPVALQPLSVLGQQACEQLLLVRSKGVEGMGLAWKGAQDPVTEADKSVHRLVVAALQTIGGGLPLVSEEGEESEVVSGDFWSLDPLDGTSEFVEDLGEYAFQLARVVNGRPDLAVVALPALGFQYLAAKGLGCWVQDLDGSAPRPFVAKHPLRRERLVLTRSLPRRPRLKQLAELHWAKEMVLLGGVGYKVHALLAGEGDTYFAVPNTLHGWDLAAPQLVAREAGLSITDDDGVEPVVPPVRHSLRKGVLFTRPALEMANRAFLSRSDVRPLLEPDPR